MYVGIVWIVVLYVPASPAVNTVFSMTSDPSILSIFGARVMLNLKIEGEKYLQQGGSHRTKSTLLGIEFVVPSIDDSADSSDEAVVDVEMCEMPEVEEIPV